MSKCSLPDVKVSGQSESWIAWAPPIAKSNLLLRWTPTALFSIICWYSTDSDWSEGCNNIFQKESLRKFIGRCFNGAHLDSTKIDPNRDKYPVQRIKYQHYQCHKWSRVIPLNFGFCWIPLIHIYHYIKKVVLGKMSHLGENYP